MGRLGRQGEIFIRFSHKKGAFWEPFFTEKSVLWVCWFAGRFSALLLVFIPIVVYLEKDTVTFGAQNLSFGRPGASSLAPWGTMGRSRGTWEDTKGHLGVQTWMTESTPRVIGVAVGKRQLVK